MGGGTRALERCSIDERTKIVGSGNYSTADQQRKQKVIALLPVMQCSERHLNEPPGITDHFCKLRGNRRNMTEMTDLNIHRLIQPDCGSFSIYLRYGKRHTSENHTVTDRFDSVPDISGYFDPNRQITIVVVNNVMPILLIKLPLVVVVFTGKKISNKVDMGMRNWLGQKFQPFPETRGNSETADLFSD